MESQFYEPRRPPPAHVFAVGARGVATEARLRSPHGLDSFHRVFASSKPQEPDKGSQQVSSRDLQSPVQVLADLAAITTLGVAAGLSYQLLTHGSLGDISDFAAIGLTVALLCAAIGKILDGTKAGVVTTGFDRLARHLRVWSIAFAALVFILFALKAGSDVSRGSVLLFFLLGLPLIGAWRMFSPKVLAPLAHRIGYAARDLIVIGDINDTNMDAFVRTLSAIGQKPPTVVRFHSNCDTMAWHRELKNLVARTIERAHDLRHGEVYLCAGSLSAGRLRAIERALSILPRAIYVVPDAQTASLVRCRPTSIGAQIAVEIRREPLNRTQRAIKRLLDLVLAGTALLFTAPFLLGVALAIKLDSRGPVLFHQTRNGYRGVPFKILKFRTMHVQEDGAVVRQASRGDTRVTRIGRFLRKSSIDEMPQLLNVLAGQMSLVGPRPHARAHDELYAREIENYEVRQHVKPGITGWAQVNGLRGETATIDQMDRRIEFDLWYAVNASLLLDLEIMARTFIEIVRHGRPQRQIV